MSEVREVALPTDGLVIVAADASLPRLHEEGDRMLVLNERMIAAYCPMGCGRTMFVGKGGYVTCSYEKCPNPTALSNILTDPETEHRVTFSRSKFTITHPLRERLGDMSKCALHAYLDDLGGPPVKEGKYRALANGSRWRFDALDDERKKNKDSSERSMSER